MRKLLLIIAAVLLIPVLVSAQSTTKTISGTTSGVTVAHGWMNSCLIQVPDAFFKVVDIGIINPLPLWFA